MKSHIHAHGDGIFNDYTQAFSATLVAEDEFRKSHVGK
jgi:hypothetical protein